MLVLYYSFMCLGPKLQLGMNLPGSTDLMQMQLSLATWCACLVITTRLTPCLLSYVCCVFVLRCPAGLC